jgi:hypothetical protein
MHVSSSSHGMHLSSSSYDMHVVFLCCLSRVLRLAFSVSRVSISSIVPNTHARARALSRGHTLVRGGKVVVCGVDMLRAGGGRRRLLFKFLLFSERSAREANGAVLPVGAAKAASWSDLSRYRGPLH